MVRAPRSRPGWALEDAARAAGARLIVGVDEVGRGPLAGPVTAAAVILPRDLDPALAARIDDSKRIPLARRAPLAQAIRDSVPHAIAHASVAEIEALNILRAAHLAMCRAVAMLAEATGAPDLVLVDGRDLPRDLTHPARAVIKGDATSLSIAAASIIAKVERDRVMVDLAQQHPAYGWDKNAGYGTPAHLAALRKCGVTPHHRRSFGTVHKILYQAQSTKP